MSDLREPSANPADDFDIWPPFFALDLAAAGLLPDRWIESVEAAARGPDRHLIEKGGAGTERWRFTLLQGDRVRERIAWTWDLYHGPLRTFASERYGRPMYAANRLTATVSLNVLAGVGAHNGWHSDMNPVTGILFATTLAEGEGGELHFRAAEGRTAAFRPRAGTFLAFTGPVLHCVTPLTVPGPRLALPMNYYDSPTDQPEAAPGDAYR